MIDKIRKIIVVKFIDGSRRPKTISITKFSTPRSVFRALKLPALKWEIWDDTQTDYFHLDDELYRAVMDFDVVWAVPVDESVTVPMLEAA